MKNNGRAKALTGRAATSVDRNRIEITATPTSRYKVVRWVIEFVPYHADQVLHALLSIHDNQSGEDYDDLPMIIGDGIIKIPGLGETRYELSEERGAILLGEEDGLQLSEADALSIFRQLLVPMRHTSRAADIAYGHLEHTRSPHLVAPPAASACFAAIALTAVAASANRKHRAATWLTTMAWPKALNMTMRRTHPMNIYGLMMIDNLIAPAAPDDVASRPPGKKFKFLRFQMIDNTWGVLGDVYNWPAGGNDTC
jgi:hypothetical protein